MEIALTVLVYGSVLFFVACFAIIVVTHFIES